MTALTDSALLVDFVLWRLRWSDLPADVKEAADRLIEQRPKRPAYLADTVIRYSEGPLIVDGITRHDIDGVDRRKAFPHQIGKVVTDLLENGCQYILIQDV